MMTRRSRIGAGQTGHTLVLVLAAILAWPIFPCTTDATHAQVTSPITSSGLNTRISTSPTNSLQYDITGGTRPGNGPNLFHSFGQFGVPSNNIANFLNETALPTSNILGRVTGGNPSNIFGTIQTTGFGSANLFLMNPAGIIFGPTASLNVGGSVSFTTADYLRLADGGKFNAMSGPQDASISSAPVAAFGFLGSNPGAILVEGSELSVPTGAGIALVGGDITIQGGTLENGMIQPARLSASSGHIHLASVATPGEIQVGSLEQGPNINGQSPGALGAIQISQTSVLDVNGARGGAVAIRGGRFVLNDSTITADSNSVVSGQPTADEGGAVTLSASTVQLENGATIRTNGENTGSAGRITIQGVGGNGSAATDVLVDNTTVSGTAGGVSEAHTPGAITITANRVVLNNGTYITADTLGAAPAGDITFNVETLTATGGPVRLHVFPESRITNPIISQPEF